MSDTEPTLEETVETFLRRNVPQIQMHGGTANIETDEETGVVHITLGGACTGCGLKPMTMQAIKRQLIEGVAAVSDVRIGTSRDSVPQPSGLDLPSDEETDVRGSDAPF